MTRLDTALAEIARRRELAQAATPGPWQAQVTGLLGGRIGVVVSAVETGAFVLADRQREARIEDGRHIAANDPAHVLAVLDAAEATLRRHRREDASPYCCCGWCSTSQHTAPWPCPDAAAVLDLYAPEDLLERDGSVG